jgi:hypothetical protein
MWQSDEEVADWSLDINFRIKTDEIVLGILKYLAHSQFRCCSVY